MKTTLRAGIVIFVMALAAQAATYWVSPTGAASWANATSQSPLAGTSAADMAAANANASAGDTVYLRGGVYGTGVAPVKSGASSSRITFKGYPGETARISGTATAINVNNKSYIVIDAVTADSNRVFADLRSANHVWILNSTLINSTDTGGWPVGILMYTNSQYNRIVNCFIGNSGYMSSNDDIGGLINLGSWSDSTDATAYNLLDGNELFHGGHHVLELASRYNIIRNNTFHNENWTKCNRPSAGNLCGNRDIGIYDDYLDSYWNVIEGNRIAFAGASIDDATGASGLTIRGAHTIVRNNVVYCNDGPGISFYADGTGTYDPRHSRVYNNVFYKNGISPLSQSDFRYTFGLLFDDVAGNNPAIPITDEAIRNNLFFRNTGGDVYFYYTDSAQQTVTGNYYATASNNSRPMRAIPGNIISTADPLFADTGASTNVASIKSFDFHVQPNSPVIDKGVFLTVTAGAGSGNVMTVGDASYFIDGYGIIGGDTIQLQGQTDRAHIVGVDYTANKITVDKSLIWISGQGVGLAYSGSAPDIGAYEYTGSAVLPPVFHGLTPVRSTIRLRRAGVTVTLPSSVRSPELTIVDLSGREVCRVLLGEASRKAGAEGEAIYECAWRGVPPAAGTYIAIVKETYGETKTVLTRTKLVASR
jgi:hypothetical protein